MHFPPHPNARANTAPALPSGTKHVPISLVIRFSHLMGSSGLRYSTFLSYSSLVSKGGEAEDLPIPGILVIPLSSFELLILKGSDLNSKINI